jgi:hypothetical protein
MAILIFSRPSAGPALLQAWFLTSRSAMILSLLVAFLESL